MLLMQNSVPIYCPALTDGSLGDMIYFHSFRNPGLVIDIVEGNTSPVSCIGEIYDSLHLCDIVLLRTSDNLSLVQYYTKIARCHYLILLVLQISRG